MFFNAPLWKQQAPLQDGSFRPQRPNRAPLAIARYAEAGPAETDLAYSRKISTKFEFAGFFARISRGIKPIVAVRRDSIGPARRPACSHTCLFSPGFTPIRTLTAQRVYLGQRLSPARLSHHSRGMRMESSPLPMPPCAATPARERATLLHGDLHTGNLLVGSDYELMVFDPTPEQDIGTPQRKMTGAKICPRELNRLHKGSGLRSSRRAWYTKSIMRLNRFVGRSRLASVH
jgi:hypothetical protein